MLRIRSWLRGSEWKTNNMFKVRQERNNRKRKFYKGKTR